jgi:transposase
MYLRSTRRIKDGKEHRYWSIVESRRCAGGKVVQRPVLYLGEINNSQREQWCRVLEGLDEDKGESRQMALFAWDQPIPAHASDIGIGIRLKDFSLQRPRQWGACWLACELYRQLKLDVFWREKLPDSREGTRWSDILQTLVCYRLICPGSEWRLHRQWFENSAMGDLLNADYSLVEKNALYRVHDGLLEHKRELFSHLQQRWKDLFGAKFEVLLYDLTSTYFETDVPDPQHSKKRFGYSRDKRSDCVQVVIALVVTPEGFPLAYEVLAGNTADKTTLEDFLKKIEDQYGKAQRIWVMDRGIPTEKVLEQMRQSNPVVQYLVGTPKGRLSRYESDLLSKPWKKVREGVEVKLHTEDSEMYVYARSHDRAAKERAMRLRQLRGLSKRLQELSEMKLTARELLLKLGEARARYRQGWRLMDIELPSVEGKSNEVAHFSYRLNWKKLRQVRRREGSYLLRANISDADPAQLWKFYIQLTEVEAAFKTLKDDLDLRPIYHQREERIEAHIFISFLAYCLHVTLRARLKAHAPGLTSRAVLDKFAAIQMLDVHFPTTDNRTLILPRYTQPNADMKLLLRKLKLELPEQPPPRITTTGEIQTSEAGSTL